VYASTSSNLNVEGKKKRGVVTPQPEDPCSFFAKKRKRGKSENLAAQNNQKRRKKGHEVGCRGKKKFFFRTVKEEKLF